MPPACSGPQSPSTLRSHQSPPTRPFPFPYLQGSQSPCTHGQGGKGVQVVVSVGWKFVPLWGQRNLEGDPAQLQGSLHPPDRLKTPLPHPHPHPTPPPRFCHRGSPEALPTPGPGPCPSLPVSPTSWAASCRVSARRERVRRTALSSSARGSGEARGGPGGGPGAAALSGHRLRATRTRQQTPGGGKKQRAQTGRVGLREEGLGVLSPRVERPG